MMISKAERGVSHEMGGERKILKNKSGLIGIRNPRGFGFKFWF